MRLEREKLLLAQIRRSAEDASIFVERMDLGDFLDDRRTQQAVAMSLLIMGENVSKLMKKHPEFVAKYPDVPWTSVVGMRNRIAHGYTDIDFRIVWSTLNESVPELLRKLPK